MRELNSERMVLLFAAAALAIFLIGAELWPGPTVGSSSLRGIGKGKTVPVEITLVTADAKDLACAADAAVGGARCAFDRGGKPWRGERTGLLAPYMTTSQVLLLIPDLFSEQAIAARLEQEPFEGKPRGDLRRFVASCSLHAQSQVKDFYVRWTPTGQWSHREDAWVGNVSGCTIRETGSDP